MKINIGTKKVLSALRARNQLPVSDFCKLLVIHTDQNNHDWSAMS